MTDFDLTVSNPTIVVTAGGMPGVQGERGPMGEVSAAELAAAVAAHEAAANPHPAYLDEAEGDVRYAPAQPPLPSAAGQVPRLARTPNPATGDLGLPGYAGSDTGVRRLDTEVVGPEVNFVFMRRSGMIVDLRIGLGTTAGTTTITVPQGFRPSLSQADLQGVFANSNGIAVARYYTTVGGATLVVVSTAAVRTNLTYSVMGSTAEQAWPTFLPGTQHTPPAQWT